MMEINYNNAQLAVSKSNTAHVDIKIQNGTPSTTNGKQTRSFEFSVYKNLITLQIGNLPQRILFKNVTGSWL